MDTTDAGLEVRLARRGISRRKFLSFCGFIAAAMAMPAAHKMRIAEALAAAQRLPVVWLAFQDCTADTESFLRSGNPTVSSILLDLISLDYHETLMAASGKQAEQSLQDTVSRFPGQYVAVVEGAIPTGAGGYYCTVGGRSALGIAREVCGSALATIAVGACAWDGGWPGAVPNPTQAVGVKDAVPGIRNFIALPGCPMNIVNFTATLVHYFTYGAWPETDALGQPLFAYGDKIHGKCERKEHYDDKEFVLEWGDQGHRDGWCLYRMGCRGPKTKSNCPKVKWNDGVNWPIGAGHGCIGCTNPRFWDAMSPFYTPLPGD